MKQAFWVVGIAIIGLVLGAIVGYSASFMQASAEIEQFKKVIQEREAEVKAGAEEIRNLKDKLLGTQASLRVVRDELESTQELLDEEKRLWLELGREKKYFLDIQSDELSGTLSEALNSWINAGNFFAGGNYEQAAGGYAEAAFWLKKAAESQGKVVELLQKLTDMAPDELKQSYARAARVAKHDERVLQSLVLLLDASSKMSEVLSELNMVKEPTETDKEKWRAKPRTV